MDASDKSFNQLRQNDLTGHQVISSFFLSSFAFTYSQFVLPD